MPELSVKTLDLFCGGGGSSWGAVHAGAQIVLGVDGWARAIETYSLNFENRGHQFLMGEDTKPADLGLKKGQIKLLLASPECTNHTCAKGSKVRDEESKRTANYVLNFARDLDPQWIVIENVVHMKQWEGYAPLLGGLADLGYGATVQTMDSSDFGVPQTRRRLFVMCEKGKAPAPVPLPGTKVITALEILDYDPITGKDKYASKRLFTKRRAKPTIERFKRGVSSIGEGHPFLLVYYGSDAAGGWQSLDRPLRTLTTLDRFGLITWREGEPFLRMLQVTEIMRAMGFKDTDNFRLTGSRREQIKQLGNGVCPPVMEAVVAHLCGQREEKEQATGRVIAKPKGRAKATKAIVRTGVLT